MSIAEKLQTIAENEQRVYDKGLEDGKQSEYDRFWDSFQSKGALQYMSYYISGTGWNNTTFKPKYDLKIGDWSERVFFKTGTIDLCARLEECGVKLDLSGCANIVYLAMDTAITTLPILDVSHISSLNYFIYNNTKLLSIEKIILKSDGTQTFLNTSFGNNTALTHVIFEGCIGNDLSFSSCPLNKESIISVVNALSATVTGKTITLKKTAVNNAFKTGTELADGSTSQEWLDLIATKQNWTISLA